MFGRKRRRLERWEMRGYADGVNNVARELQRQRPCRPDEPILGEDTEPRELSREERLAYNAGKARGEDAARGQSDHP